MTQGEAVKQLRDERQAAERKEAQLRVRKQQDCCWWLAAAAAVMDCTDSSDACCACRNLGGT